MVTSVKNPLTADKLVLYNIAMNFPQWAFAKDKRRERMKWYERSNECRRIICQ